MKIDIALPVRFDFAGQFHSSKGWELPPRCISHFVVILVQRGKCYVWEDKQRFELNPGDVFFLRSNHEHFIKSASDDDSLVYYWAHFNPHPGELSPDRVITVNQLSQCKNFDKMTVYFHQLINENFLVNKNISIHTNKLFLDYLLSLILIQVATEPSKGNSTHLYARIRDYIQLNYRHNLTLHKLAEVFPYNTDYMSRVFKSNAGISIKQYIHALRLEEAKRRLLTTLDTIQQIANACGYTNEKFFITTFTKHEGLTPTQYRNLFSELYVHDE